MEKTNIGYVFACCSIFTHLYTDTRALKQQATDQNYIHEISLESNQMSIGIGIGRYLILTTSMIFMTILLIKVYNHYVDKNIPKQYLLFDPQINHSLY